VTALTEFFLLLGALYLAECVLRAPRGAVAFVPWFWSGWRILKGADFYGNPRWGFLLGNPAPGLGGAALCELWPVSLSPEGAYSYVAQTFNPGQRHEQPSQFHRFEDINQVEWADFTVFINGEVFVKTAAPLFARRLAVVIRELARMPFEKRAAKIDQALRAALDVKSVRTRWEEYERATSWVGLWSDLLFGLFFLVSPAAAWWYGLAVAWPVLLLALAVLLVLAWVSYFLAHRRLYPEWKSDRLVHLAFMIPLPPATARAPAFLLRSLLSEFHPLALARVFCTPERFLEFAGAMLRDIEHPVVPVCPSEELGPARTEEYFRGRLGAVVREFVVAEGFQADALAAAPVREGEDHLSYCARCHCQFIIASGECQTCNLPLEVFAGSAAAGRT